MRTSPRGRFKPGKLESLESRSLLSTATPSAPPTVGYVQFEPLTGRILVTYTGDAAGYNNASLTNPANYSISPVFLKTKLPNPDPSRPSAGITLVPQFVVTGVTLSTPVAAGQPQSVLVSVNNNQPFKFGTYRFTINASGITDNAGNQLDGAYSGVFPSGNGVAGSNFVANLTQSHSTVLPASPVTSPPATPSNGEVAPGYVFYPSTRPVRVRYLAARPAVFQLAGGNRIRLQALPHQFFPGTFRASFRTTPPRTTS